MNYRSVDNHKIIDEQTWETQREGFDDQRNSQSKVREVYLLPVVSAHLVKLRT